MIGQASWIWNSAGAELKDYYCCFRKTFRLEKLPAEPVFLAAAADTTFSAYINGVRCPFTQFSDFPRDQTFDAIDISQHLHAGLNAVAIEVHFLGDDFHTAIAGKPGLTAAVYSGGRLLARTDASWKALPNPAYHSGLACKTTRQLGFAWEYDARRELPWTECSYDDSSWPDAALCPETWHPNLSARPVPQLKESDPVEVVLAQHGLLWRTEEKDTFANTCAADFLRPLSCDKAFAALSPPGNDGYWRAKLKIDPAAETNLSYCELPAEANGYYLIADFRREMVGWPVIRLTAPAGTVVDVVHGEHLEDGRCRAAIAERNFTDRYICREGLNVFMHPHRRIGGRYLELHITNCGGGRVVVHYAGIIPVDPPLPAAAEFVSEDNLLGAVNRVSIDTMRLCMHEHYEDCPWREQALYAYDSRNQIMYGYYVWGNYDFAAASLDLLGKSYQGNGYLALTAPGKCRLTIPAFTLVWISELYEHWLYSGSGRLFAKYANLVDEIINLALERRAGELYVNSDHVWNFYEWRGRLNQVDEYPQSLYNIYLVEALRAAASLHALNGNPARSRELNGKAEELGRAVEAAFHQARTGCYLTTLSDPEIHELTQMLMLYNRLVPAEKTAGVLDAVFNRRVTKLTYSSLYYMVNAMMSCGPAARLYLDQFLLDEFSAPVLGGATSLWETEFGASDFHNAGSLCHAWSSVMPYYCGSKVLGVTPLEPGFGKFSVQIYPGHLTHAEGSVPTPHGHIQVSWRLDRERRLRVAVRHPGNLKMEIAQYEEFPVRDATVL